MDRKEARAVTIDLLERYAARLIEDIDAMIAAENLFREAEGQDPTTNEPERYRRSYERRLERYVGELLALPEDDSPVHPLAAWSLRFHSEAAEHWLNDKSQDHEGRSMWFGILAREALEALDPAYDPGPNADERMAAIESDGAGLASLERALRA